MKAVMMSIQPKWCELIANGKKTIEVRKTKPKFEMPFKCYIYCTKPKMHLVDVIRDGEDVYGEIYHGETKFIKVAESSTYGTMCWKYQKVIGEFVCNEIGTYTNYSLDEQNGHIKRRENLLRCACMTLKEWRDYIGGNKSDFGYAWHISDVAIYDKPKELSEFFVTDNSAVQSCSHREITGQPEYKTAHNGWIKGSYICNANGEPDWCTKCKLKPITRPPLSWCYVEELK